MHALRTFGVRLGSQQVGLRFKGLARRIRRRAGAILRLKRKSVSA